MRVLLPSFVWRASVWPVREKRDPPPTPQSHSRKRDRSVHLQRDYEAWREADALVQAFRAGNKSSCAVKCFWGRGADGRVANRPEEMECEMSGRGIVTSSH